MDKPDTETKQASMMFPSYGYPQGLTPQQLLYNPMAAMAQLQLLMDPSKPMKPENTLNCPVPGMYNLPGAGMLQNPYNQLNFPLQTNFGDILPFPGALNLPLASTQPLKVTSNTKPAVTFPDTIKAAPTVQQPAQQPVKRQTKITGKTAKKRRRVSVKLCNVEGCSKLARSTTMFCAAHGGGRRCLTPGCTKAARGATSYCIAHGGGRRCKHPLCSKSAQGSTYFCIAHGGGRRCKNPDCSKSARGPAGFCKAHGGGRKCDHEGCTKSAAEGASFCRPHGGGVKCCKEGCPRTVKRNQTMCADHMSELKSTASAAAPLNSRKENLIKNETGKSNC